MTTIKKKIIKRLVKFDDENMEKELDNLTKQLPHEADVVYKNSVSGTLEFYVASTSGGSPTTKVTLKFTDGQITVGESV